MAKPDTEFIKQRAPTLYIIIAIKLLKGSLFVVAALVAYVLSDNVLPDEFRKVVLLLHLQPGAQFSEKIAAKLATITERQALVFAAATLVYSSFSLIEGIGLMFRVSWAGWLAIGEAVFFIPIEINSLLSGWSWYVFVVLLLNIFIVWYLFQNRHRLFHHHHPHHEPPPSLPAPSGGVGQSSGG
jgi:uncharacterized membrane protein (DUF2068 family)